MGHYKLRIEKVFIYVQLIYSFCEITVEAQNKDNRMNKGISEAR